MNIQEKQRFFPYLVEILFWLLTLLAMVLFIRASVPFRFQHLALLIITIGSFYAPLFIFKHTTYQWFSSKGLLIMVGPMLLSFLFDFALLSVILPDSIPVVRQQAALLLVMYFSLSGILFQGFYYSFSGRQREQQLEKEKIELEMNLIRSQLNPHFLFNVLNNIDHFVRKDPEKASHSIIQLSTMLRYLLYESAQMRVPLTQEAAFLEEYIELQKQRIQDGNTCTFRKEIADPNIMVVPALFLPFLENAFSHCPMNQPGNFLYFELIGIPGKITFIGRNTRQAAQQSERSGLGLSLARKRLEIFYPDAHQLHIMETAHHFSVELILQVN